MLIFICDLDETDVGRQGICFSGGLGDRIDECTSSQLIGAWAVGGEVNHVSAKCMQESYLGYFSSNIRTLFILKT